jgi:hypothetical protein
MHIADGLLLMWRGDTELSGRHGYTAPAAAGALLAAVGIVVFTVSLLIERQARGVMLAPVAAR